MFLLYDVRCADTAFLDMMQARGSIMVRSESQIPTSMAIFKDMLLAKIECQRSRPRGFRIDADDSF